MTFNVYTVVELKIQVISYKGHLGDAGCGGTGPIQEPLTHLFEN